MFADAVRLPGDRDRSDRAPSLRGTPFGDAAFGVDAFRRLLRSELVGQSRMRAQDALSDEGELSTFDVEPDVSTAWVYGLYWVALRRLPDQCELTTGIATLHDGGSPSASMAALIESDETHPIEHDAKALFLAYVTGCYLAALGRRPDPVGLEGHVQALSEGLSERDLLRSFLQSPEALGSLRFPPAKQDEIVALADALQIVGLKRAPDRSLTEALVKELASGVQTDALLRGLMRRDRRIRGSIRSLFSLSARLQQVEKKASAIVLQRELLATRAWQWRVDRETWRRIGDLTTTVELIAERMNQVDQRTASFDRRSRV
jgi:hypothetical protein